MTPVNCPKCGAAHSVGAVRCSVCGGVLPTKSAPKPSRATGPVLVSSSGKRYSLVTGDVTLIGSRGCAVLLSAPGVAPVHAKLHERGGAFDLEIIAPGVVLNGRPVSGSHPLHDGDSIQIAGEGLVLHASASPRRAVLAVPTPAPRQAPASRSIAAGSGRRSSGDIEGHVLFVDGPHMEDPDVTPLGCLWRTFTSMLIFPLLIRQPGGLIAYLMGRREEKIPVRYVRVSDHGGQVRVARLKGELVAGMISQGDEVAFRGSWDGGTLRVTDGMNFTANTQISLRS